MANQNNEKRFTITTLGGEELTLTKETVIKYLANGAPITDPEFNMFFQLCKTYKCNPFLREAYIIKYGSQPAQIIIDYKFLQSQVEKNSHYRGMKTGIVVADKDGKITEKAPFMTKDETLIAAWCEIYRDDRECPTKVYSMNSEFNTGKANWLSKPLFMLVKVAKAQALREAFPNLLGSNVYTSEEETTFEKDENYYDVKEAKKQTTITNSIIDDLPKEPVEEIFEAASDDLPFDENGVIENE